MKSKTLKLIIASYDNAEMYIQFSSKDFNKAQEIIEDAANEWEKDDDLRITYGDVCDYYEEKLDEAGIDYSYVNYDEVMSIL